MTKSTNPFRQFYGSREVISHVGGMDKVDSQIT